MMAAFGDIPLIGMTSPYVESIRDAPEREDVVHIESLKDALEREDVVTLSLSWIPS